MRTCVAIDLPPLVRREVASSTAALRGAAPELAWVPEARLHLTLKFAGEQEGAMVAAIADAVVAVAARHRPFELEVGGIGAFPSWKRPRVVWAGIAPEPRLELLQHDLECALERIGLPLDGRPFRPHLTLARVRVPLGAERGRAVARAARGVQLDATVPVGTVDVMESARVGGRVVYRVVRAGALAHG